MPLGLIVVAVAMPTDSASVELAPAHADELGGPALGEPLPGDRRSAYRAGHGLERPGVRLVDRRDDAAQQQPSGQPGLGAVQVDDVGPGLVDDPTQAPDLADEAGAGVATGLPPHDPGAGRARGLANQPEAGQATVTVQPRASWSRT